MNTPGNKNKQYLFWSGENNKAYIYILIYNQNMTTIYSVGNNGVYQNTKHISLH